MPTQRLKFIRVGKKNENRTNKNGNIRGKIVCTQFRTLIGALNLWHTKFTTLNWRHIHCCAHNRRDIMRKPLVGNGRYLFFFFFEIYPTRSITC